MLGGPNTDFLWGGNGLDFMDGNGGTDYLYGNDGMSFVSADDGVGGTAWLRYPQASTASGITAAPTPMT